MLMRRATTRLTLLPHAAHIGIVFYHDLALLVLVFLSSHLLQSAYRGSASPPPSRRTILSTANLSLTCDFDGHSQANECERCVCIGGGMRA